MTSESVSQIKAEYFKRGHLVCFSRLSQGYCYHQ